MKKGFALTELLVAIVIVVALGFISFRMVNAVIQRAKTVSARAQIAQISQVLETVKSDTGLYPIALDHLLLKTPPAGIENGWRGPYMDSLPYDPWDTSYFYMIPSTNLFESPPIERRPGQPQTYSFTFQATAQTVRMRLENFGIASATVRVNGVTVFGTSYFNHRPPHPQILENDLVLVDGTNTIDIWVASGPTRYFLAYITGFFPTGDYFILGSYGSDGEEGGENFAADIVWRSDTYPNFQE